VLDLRLLREDPAFADRVRTSQRARGEPADLVDAVLAADAKRRNALTEYERLRAEQ
jgi:seryl-tRNA synthetase